jgi:hypothetical protein
LLPEICGPRVHLMERYRINGLLFLPAASTIAIAVHVTRKSVTIISNGKVKPWFAYSEKLSSDKEMDRRIKIPLSFKKKKS